MIPIRRLGLAIPFATVALAGATLTGCGDSAKVIAGAKPVDVQITDAGCAPAILQLPAGPTTFNVTSTGSGKVTEYEVMSGDKIEGEVENVTPGLKRSFSLNLKAGTYGLRCPGGTNSSDGQLTVTGDAAALTPSASVDNYRKYVTSQMEVLVARTKEFTDAVIAGDVAKAKSMYPSARVPYETIEPVAESFGDLDPAIDGRADDTPVESITGFHRIEYALWEKNTTADMTPIAEKLYTDVVTLSSKAATLDIDAPKIANGANELLGEVSKSKVTGEEERYSHTDLWDFDANVSGAKAAIASVRPELDKRDAALGTTIDQRFAAVEAALAPYKDGSGWKLYNTLSAEDTKKLSQAVDALAEPLSQVAGKVVG